MRSMVEGARWRSDEQHEELEAIFFAPSPPPARSARHLPRSAGEEPLCAQIGPGAGRDPSVRGLLRRPA